MNHVISDRVTVHSARGVRAVVPCGQPHKRNSNTTHRGPLLTAENVEGWETQAVLACIRLRAGGILTTASRRTSCLSTTG